jgi:hypothetical protein
MLHTKEAGRAVAARTGFRNVQLTTDASEYAPTHHHLQAARIRGWVPVSEPVARVIADLAFRTVRRRA